MMPMMENNVSYKSFIAVMKPELEQAFAPGMISYSTISKPGREELDAILFSLPGNENLKPTLYFNDLYDSFCNGADISELVDMISELVSRPLPEFDTEAYLNYANVKDSLLLRVFNRDKASGLDGIPCRRFNDLVVCAYIPVENTVDMYASMAVKTEMLDSWGISEEQLFRDAKENQMNSFYLRDIRDAIDDLFFGNKDGKEMVFDFDHPDFPEGLSGQSFMVAKCNGIYSFGASFLCNEEITRKLGELLGDYYILPSSTHECLIYPMVPDGLKPEELKTMVMEVNSAEVKPEEQLSNEIYEAKGPDYVPEIWGKELIQGQNQEMEKENDSQTFSF